MSDNVLSVIPADPDWQPTAEAADAAMAVLRRLAPQLDGFVTTEYRTTWHERVVAVDCGANLERIECPACQNAIASSGGLICWRNASRLGSRTSP